MRWMFADEPFEKWGEVDSIEACRYTRDCYGGGYKDFVPPEVILLTPAELEALQREAFEAGTDHGRHNWKYPSYESWREKQKEAK